MKGKFFLGWVAVFVVWMAGSFVVHGVLLHDDYGKLPNLMRTEADSQQHFPLMILAHVIMAGAFVWIYARGIEPKPWLAQGIRFGVAVALLAVVPTYIDLLRRAADAGRAGRQADPLRRDPDRGPRRGRGVRLPVGAREGLSGAVEAAPGECQNVPVCERGAARASAPRAALGSRRRREELMSEERWRVVGEIVRDVRLSEPMP